MQKDLVLIDNKLINICNMGEYFYDKKAEKKFVPISIENTTTTISRDIIKVPRKDIDTFLFNKGIEIDLLELKLKSFIDNHIKELTNDGFHEKHVIESKMAFYKRHHMIGVWKEELHKIIEAKAKPKDSFFFFSDFEYEDYLFTEYNANNEIESFLLKENLDITLEPFVSDALYNLPFLNDNEILYLCLSMYPNVDEIEIDITERSLEYRQKIKNTAKIIKNTLYLNRFEKEGKAILNKSQTHKDDDLILNLLIIHLITIFETYIKGISKLAINNSNYYLRTVIEKDSRFYHKKNKIEYNKLFETMDKLKKEVNDFIDESSFQGVETVKNYLESIFLIDASKLEKFILEYAKLLTLRNLIVHNNGYCKDETRIKIQTNEVDHYYSVINGIINEIDKKVFFNIIN